MASKGPEAFRTISEVADELDLPQHVLRFWETRFTQIRPMKRGGGRRYYRPDDVELLRGIRTLLYGQGYTIRGVQRLLKEQGPRFVVATGRAQSAPPAANAETAGRSSREEPGRVSTRPGGRMVAAAPVDDDMDADGSSEEAAAIDADITAASGATEEDGSIDLDTTEEDVARVAPEDEEDSDRAGDAVADEDSEDDDEAEEEDEEPEDAVPAFNPRDFRPRPVAPTAVPSRGQWASLASPASRSTLSKEDVRRLHGTLAHLLELKRLLDAARG